MAFKTVQRKYELDWLRVFAILVVFLYHSSRFFNLGDWHVKNLHVYVWVEIWNVFVTRWMMPLFFVISGASLYLALEKKEGWKLFYQDKFLRLMIPVLLASITHGALQVYLERVNHGRFVGSFLAFIPEYFNGTYTGIGLAASGNFANIGMHLWYLVFLFIYSLICYPLFIWLKGGGQGFLNRVTRIFSLPGLIYVWFAIPVFALKGILSPSIFDFGNGGWGFITYLWFLIAGFIIVSSDNLQETIRKQRWVSLILGFILSAIQLYLLFGVSEPALQGNRGDWVGGLLSIFSAWTWIFAIVGFGMQHLRFNKPQLSRLNEGVLPFFILHQSVLLLFGYFILPWEIHDALKWVAIFISSFAFIIMVYVILIRPIDLFRFLFGMKTTGSIFKVFRKRGVPTGLLALWVGLTAFTVIIHQDDMKRNQYPMPLNYDLKTDIILNAESITGKSSNGVQVIRDSEASIGIALEFFSGAISKVSPNPEVYFEARFTAPAGRYFVWMRGKSDVDSELTDSVWLQIDNQIGTSKGSVHLGNWNSLHPIGKYAWAGDVHVPLVLNLKHSGEHIILVQPRQVPHRIDQIWLSQAQSRIPDSFAPLN